MSKGRVLVICWILLSSQFAGADCVAAAARLVQQPGAVTNDGLFTCSRSLQSEEQNVITKIITNGISCRIPSSQRILSIIDEHSAPDMAHSRRYDANLWHKTSRNWEKWWVMTRGQWDGLAVISWPIKDEDFYLATHSCTHRLTTHFITTLSLHIRPDLTHNKFYWAKNSDQDVFCLSCSGNICKCHYIRVPDLVTGADSTLVLSGLIGLRTHEDIRDKQPQCWNLWTFWTFSLSSRCAASGCVWGWSK